MNWKKKFDHDNFNVIFAFEEILKVKVKLSFIRNPWEVFSAKNKSSLLAGTMITCLALMLMI